MSKSLKSFAIVAGTFAIAACTDAPLAPRTNAPQASVRADLQAESGNWFFHYAVIGTSISQGWASEGVYGESQYNSWPAQLARWAGVEITQPYILFPGCRSPWASPLILFKRISSEPVPPSPSLSCAPNRADVRLPTQNVAISGARAWNIIFSTPENMDPNDANAKLYARVLPPNTTQLQAMRMRQPVLVSVEVGGNEVLGARGGLVAIPQVIEDPSVFARQLDEILAAVKSVSPSGVLLVGLINDLRPIPGFRRGDEIWADRGAFLAAFNVNVSNDCQGSSNYVTVPLRIPAVVGAGLIARANGQPPVAFSCADVPNVADGILTLRDVDVLRGILARYNSIIKGRALQNGWAYFELEALYGFPGIKPPFSVVALMTGPTPYGPYISLDGFHPTALGQRLLALAAAQALNARYNLGITPNAILANAAQ